MTSTQSSLYKSNRDTVSQNADDQVVLHWYLPTYGDSRNIMAGGHGAGNHVAQRPATLNYLTQLAHAAESNGFESILTPTGQWCEDAFLTTAALISATTRLKFLVAVRPGLTSPLVQAQQIKTFQDLSKGRLAINIVVGGEDQEQQAFGDFSTKEDRYNRAGEFLEITQHLLSTTDPLSINGDFFHLEKAGLSQTPEVIPPIYFGGSSLPGIKTAAQYANVYLTWGENPNNVEEKLAKVREEAAAVGRQLEYGIRLHVIARATEEEAWAEAQRLQDQLDEDTVARVQAGLARSQSEGQRRQAQLHDQGHSFSNGTSARTLEISPNLWAGIGLVRGGAGTALVGSYEQVAQRIAEYKDAGIKHFILSGYPHLEEAFQVGEGVVPALQALGTSVKNHEESPYV